MRALPRTAWWAALACVLLLAPLPLGSENTEWSMPLAACCLCLGVSGAVLGPLLRRERIEVPLRLLPLAAFTAFAFLQVVPLPAAVVETVSPEIGRLPPLPGEEGHSSLSVYPGATFERALLLLGLLFLLWALLRSPSRRALRLLAVAGLAHAVLAFVMSETGGTGSSGGVTRLLFTYEFPEVLTPFGTYVNKNHFAGLMSITSGGCLAVLLWRWQNTRRRFGPLGMRAMLAAATGRKFFRLLLPGTALVAVVLALWASGSRGGVLAFFGAFVIMAVATGFVLRKRYIRPLALALSGFLVLAIAATALSSTSVLERFMPEGRFLNRPRLWKDVSAMGIRYLVPGTGLGTFPYIYPRYQSFEPDRQFTHAEGDWVEYFAETGLVGTLALASFGLLIAVGWVRGVRANPSRRGLLVGAGVGIVAIVLHGFLDVSLHRPANMLAMTVLLGGLLGKGREAKEERSGAAEGIE